MKHIKFTYVTDPVSNGPAFPAVAGLQFVWARESQYPTDVPEFFGTCPDASATQVDGVLGVFVQADWEGMQADEMLARETKSAQGKRITRLAFRNRFTSAEKVALEIAALDDPAAPMAQRQQSAAVRASVADTAAAEFIDLSRQDTRAGVQMLEAGGLLAVGRALEILDSPVVDSERYKAA